MKICSVSKAFRAENFVVDALAEIDLEVKKGEFLSLVGPSGCGKSTLLNILGGLLPPSMGGICIRGKLVRDVPDDVGYMFQDPVLLPWRNVIKNVLLPLEVRGMDSGEAWDLAREQLALVGLTEFRDRHPHELSGGMKQRVALARTLVSNPSILLMDEPFGALDAITREKLNLVLLKIWEKNKKTVVFVTHSISEAVLLSDRVIIFSPRPGRIKRVTDIDIERPRHPESIDGRKFSELISVVRKTLGYLEESEA